MKVLRDADHPAQPWKNGFGITRVVARSPEAAGADRFDDELMWHVSLPEISKDAAFSALPGLDRQWMILKGGGANFVIAAGDERFTHRVARPLEPFAFSGDWRVRCKLLGAPITAFNVMTRRGRATATLEVRSISGATPIEKADEALLLFIVAGSARVLADGRSERLDAYDAMLLDESRPSSASVSTAAWGEATVIVLRLTLLNSGA